MEEKTIQTLIEEALAPTQKISDPPASSSKLFPATSWGETPKGANNYTSPPTSNQRIGEESSKIMKEGTISSILPLKRMSYRGKESICVNKEGISIVGDDYRDRGIKSGRNMRNRISSSNSSDNNIEREYNNKGRQHKVKKLSEEIENKDISEDSNNYSGEIREDPEAPNSESDDTLEFIDEVMPDYMSNSDDPSFAPTTSNEEDLILDQQLSSFTSYNSDLNPSSPEQSESEFDFRIQHQNINLLHPNYQVQAPHILPQTTQITPKPRGRGRPPKSQTTISTPNIWGLNSAIATKSLRKESKNKRISLREFRKLLHTAYQYSRTHSKINWKREHDIPELYRDILVQYHIKVITILYIHIYIYI